MVDLVHPTRGPNLEFYWEMTKLWLTELYTDTSCLGLAHVMGLT